LLDNPPNDYPCVDCVLLCDVVVHPPGLLAQPLPRA
jgi:hypothetical protein